MFEYVYKLEAANNTHPHIKRNNIPTDNKRENKNIKAELNGDNNDNDGRQKKNITYKQTKCNA